MSHFFGIKCTKFAFCLGSTGGAYGAHPYPLAVFKGPFSKGREENGRGGKELGRKGKGE